MRPIRLLAVIFALVGVILPVAVSAQPRTPEEAAVVRTDSLRQQLTHVANRRHITPCEAYARFHTVRPFDSALDPWGRRIEFECREGILLVRSIGADGESGTDDDIVSGNAPEPPDAPISAVSPDAPADKSQSRRFPFGAAALLLVAAIVAWVVVQDVRS